jgi:hypothetical protein
MWLKSIIILIIIILFVYVLWKATSSDMAYFDGTTIFQIPSPLFTKGVINEISIALKFPNNDIRDGVVLFMRQNDDFQIVYIQDGKLIVNTNNDTSQSLIMIPDLDKINKKEWVRFGIVVMDQFKNAPVYFGGAPNTEIPTNTLIHGNQAEAVQFPTIGLMACTNYCYMNDTNLSKLFQKQGIKPYC